MENKYSVSLSKKAQKFIRKQDKVSQKRIIKAIIEIPEGDIKKLKGLEDLYRLRVGDFRILFEKKLIKYFKKVNIAKRTPSY